MHRKSKSCFMFISLIAMLFFTFNTIGVNASDFYVAPKPIQVAAGVGHTLILYDNGKVAACGNNFSGQLGMGDRVSRSTPEFIPGLTKVKQIAAGYSQSYALVELYPGFNIVKAWGNNSNGQLGLGDTITRDEPTEVLGLTGVQQIGAGWDHVLVKIYENGQTKIKAWGFNGQGQLGLGDTVDRLSPIQITSGLSGGGGIKQLVGGYYHSFAVMTNGTVRAWGGNDFGLLGLGDTSYRNTPQIVPNMTGVEQIAAGDSHTAALIKLPNGTKIVKIWGANSFGQLGLGHTTSIITPTQVPGLTGVKDLAGGGGHTLAIMNNGTLMTWGYNISGQLGLGHTNDITSPQLIPNLTGIKQVSAKYHSLMLKDDGTVYSCGYNASGQLGVGVDDTTDRSSPTQMNGL